MFSGLTLPLRRAFLTRPAIAALLLCAMSFLVGCASGPTPEQAPTEGDKRQGAEMRQQLRSMQRKPGGGPNVPQ